MSSHLVPKGLEAFNPAQLGDMFNDKAWKGELPFRDEFLALGEAKISRRHVFDAFRACPQKGVTWAIVWGYPRGKISHFDGVGADALRAIGHAAKFAEVVSNVGIRSLPTAHDLIQTLNKVSKGAGTSTTTKIAYFSSSYVREGQCLIFDKQVIKAIFMSSDRALMPLRNAIVPDGMRSSDPVDDLITKATESNMQAKLYGRYLKEINALSFRLGKRHPRDKIEQFLFAKGRGDI